MDIITGYTGEAHITSAQDRAGNQGIVGEGSYILNVGNKLAADVISANEIRIRDGVLSHQGCFGIIESGTYDSLTIANGAQGMLRHDLIVCRYTKNAGTNVEGLALVVIQGTASATNPADPTYNSGDIQTGDSPVDFPLYRVNIDGITIDSVDQVASIAPSAEKQAEALGILENRGFAHVDSYTIPGSGWQTVTSVTIPANNTGHDITYKICGIGMFAYKGSVVNAEVSLSVWWDNVHHGRDVQVMSQVAPYGLDAFGYVTIPNGGAGKQVILFVNDSTGAGTVTDCAIWYEPIAWT